MTEHESRQLTVLSEVAVPVKISSVHCAESGKPHGKSSGINVAAHELDHLDRLVEELNDAADMLKRHSKSLTEAPRSVATTTSENLRRAKQALLSTTMAIQQSLSSPIDFQQQMTIHYQHAAAVRWLCRFGIPTHVPIKSSVTYAAIAKQAAVPEDQLRRIIRMSMTAGVFKEDNSGGISHTPISLEMKQDPSFVDTVLFMTETNMPVAARMVEMTEEFHGSEDRTASAFNIAVALLPISGPKPCRGKASRE